MEPLLLTVGEVAEVLHIGRTKVFDLIATQQIRSVKIGQLRRVPAEAVREYMARLVAEQWEHV